MDANEIKAGAKFRSPQGYAWEVMSVINLSAKVISVVAHSLDPSIFDNAANVTAVFHLAAMSQCRPME